MTHPIETHQDLKRLEIKIHDAEVRANAAMRELEECGAFKKGRELAAYWLERMS